MRYRMFLNSRFTTFWTNTKGLTNPPENQRYTREFKKFLFALLCTFLIRTIWQDELYKKVILSLRIVCCSLTTKTMASPATRTALLFVLGCVSVQGLGLTRFQSFMREHKKVYTTRAEEATREAIFNENLKMIEAHNANPNNKWTMKMNQFGDLTQQEFKDTVLSGYKRLPASGDVPSGAGRVVVEELPESVDWRDAGVITEVKNQGSCGSCWAFATTQQVESYAMINNLTVADLSTQEVTTCTPNPLHCGGTGGCKGSIPQLGYNYVQLFGITTEDEYPYWSGVTGMTGNCKYDLEKRTPVVGITGYNTLPANDLEATLAHVANVGPLAIAGDATLWQFYGNGVFDGCDYEDSIELNHAIQLVGYGTEGGEDFWLVRNSWGRLWGDEGYIKLKRESSLVCGTDNNPMMGTACENGPGNDVQTVCGMCGMLFDSSYPLGAYSFHL